jgi:hypothetical protein
MTRGHQHAVPGAGAGNGFGSGDLCFTSFPPSDRDSCHHRIPLPRRDLDPDAPAVTKHTARGRHIDVRGAFDVGRNPVAKGERRPTFPKHERSHFNGPAFVRAASGPLRFSELNSDGHHLARGRLVRSGGPAGSQPRALPRARSPRAITTGGTAPVVWGWPAGREVANARQLRPQASSASRDPRRNSTRTALRGAANGADWPGRPSACRAGEFPRRTRGETPRPPVSTRDVRSNSLPTGIGRRASG